MNLQEIEKHIALPLQHFHEACDKMMDSQVPIIRNINRQLLTHNGKQLRPLLTLLSACCCGFPLHAEADHPLFAVSAAIETLHNATLIHDDVVDESDTRRGQPTVNKQWSNKIAVLVGDYYLAQVMLTINAANKPEVTQIINRTVIDMTEGELLQQECCGHYDIGEETYNSIIRKKTACFMAACCETGAIFATDDEAIRHAARDFGEHIGMAFQLRDDLLDYLPTAVTGKPQGNDLREHKATLPLILAMRHADSHTKKEISSLLGQTHLDDSDIDRLTTMIATPAMMDVARQHLNAELEKARQSARQLPDNGYRDDLMQLILMLQE